MADDSSIYREAILRHARHPSNRGRLEHPDRSARASNPLCGDEIEVTLMLDGDRIGAVNFLARGCTIVQASASLTSERVGGLTLAQAAELGQRFRAAMEGPDADLPRELEPLEPLTAVKRHRSRIRCALLPWDALAACAGEGGNP